MNVRTHDFTPTEAAALAELTEKQVRKEIEYNVIRASSPPRLSFPALVYLYLVRRSALALRVQDRTDLYQRIEHTLALDPLPEHIEVAPPFLLRLSPEVEALTDKVDRFFAWKQRLVANPDIMGGSETFPGSRLTVRHIGGLIERGADIDEIREDYPYLADDDIEFAQLFVRAYPLVGRPASR